MNKLMAVLILGSAMGCGQSTPKELPGPCDTARSMWENFCKKGDEALKGCGLTEIEIKRELTALQRSDKDEYDILQACKQQAERIEKIIKEKEELLKLTPQ